MTDAFAKWSRRIADWSGLTAVIALTGLTLLIADRPSALTRSTIHLALLEFALSLWLMMGLGSADWRVQTPRGRFTRGLWTWACVTFLLHVACAFHFTHHWSHTHAFEQTRLESGFGEGLYVNYLFMTLWAGDVVWWWLAADGYARRSPWIDRILHAFMLFIAANATVVFERGGIRVAGAAGLLLLASRWIRRSRRPSLPERVSGHPVDPSA